MDSGVDTYGTKQFKASYKPQRKAQKLRSEVNFSLKKCTMVTMVCAKIHLLQNKIDRDLL